jgi:DNA-binding MarR family transcriptional regulator
MKAEDGAISAAQLEELRQRNIGKLFLQAHRAFSERSIEKLRARGHAGLGLAHTQLLIHLELVGTRITTLAERAGVTKQAMGQLADALSAQGYVTKTTDPADRRATLVNFTDRGWQFLRDAHLVKREIEAEYTALLGEEQWEMVNSGLQRLIAHARMPHDGTSEED